MEKIHPKVKEKIESVYKYCFNRTQGNAKYVLDNFQYNDDVKKEMYKEIYEYLIYEYDIEIDKNDLMFIYEGVLNSFILNKRKDLNIPDTINGKPTELEMLQRIEKNQRWLGFMYMMNSINK